MGFGIFARLMRVRCVQGDSASGTAAPAARLKAPQSQAQVADPAGQQTPICCRPTRPRSPRGRAWALPAA